MTCSKSSRRASSGQSACDIRLPSEFRELVANQGFTNDEIGRIVRCIVMNSDLYLSPRIEPEVFRYRKIMARKESIRKRVAAHRMRKSGVVPDAEKQADPPSEECVTVTDCEKSASSDGSSLSNSEKTPTILLEKRPPIVPLEKSTPSSLEKSPSRKRTRRKRDRVLAGIQDDLFSLVSGVGCVESKETSLRRLQNRSECLDEAISRQDIEIVSDGVYGPPEQCLSDTRVDSAWIPQKFEVFWMQYPRKVAKGAAMKAFTKIIKSQRDVESFMSTIMASVAWWKMQDAWKKDGGKYIPHPATWLNRGSWEDSVDNSGPGSSSAQFLADAETDEDLIRRMGGQNV